MPVRPLAVARLGTIDYAACLALQRRLLDARHRGAVGDVLLLLEHPATITHSYTGRGLENLVATPEELAARGVVVEPTDRGGNITLHAPGQLVGYPIVELEQRDLIAYLRRLEDVLIATAAAFGQETSRVGGRTGTWTPDGRRKLAAIGVKTSRWVTMHGFAMNVSTDLSLFDLIVPCGLADAGVTSLEQLIGEAPPLDRVADAAEAAFAEVFDCAPSQPDREVARLLRLTTEKAAS